MTRLVRCAQVPGVRGDDVVLQPGMASGASISYDRLEDLVAELNSVSFVVYDQL